MLVSSHDICSFTRLVISHVRLHDCCQVSLLLNVDNLRARRNVPLNERWSMLQADHVLYVDGRREAAMIGTGHCT